MADETEPETTETPKPDLPPDGASLSEIIDFFYQKSHPEGFPKYGFYDYLKQLMEWGWESSTSAKDRDASQKASKELEQFFRELWNYLLGAFRDSMNEFYEYFKNFLEPFKKIGCSDPLSEIIEAILALFDGLKGGIVIPLAGGSKTDTLDKPATSFTCSATWLTVILDGQNVLYSADATDSPRETDVDFTIVDSDGKEIIITKKVNQGDNVDELLGWINDVFNKIKALVPPKTGEDYFNDVMDMFLGKPKELWDYIKNFFDNLTDLFSDGYNTMSNFVDNLDRSVREAARQILSLIESAIIALLQPFIDIIQALLDLLESAEDYWYLSSDTGEIPSDMSNTTLITCNGYSVDIGTPEKTDDPNYTYQFVGDGWTALYSYSSDALKIQIAFDDGTMEAGTLKVADDETTESGVRIVTWKPDKAATVLDSLSDILNWLKEQVDIFDKLPKIPEKISLFNGKSRTLVEFESFELMFKIIVNLLFYLFWLFMHLTVEVILGLLEDLTEQVSRLAGYA